MSALTQIRRPCSVKALAELIGTLKGLSLNGLEVSALIAEIDDAARDSLWFDYSSIDLEDISAQIYVEHNNIIAQPESEPDESWKRRQDEAVGYGV